MCWYAVHGDARGDNCFRREADQGLALVWLDWQMTHTGSPAYEISHTMYRAAALHAF